MFFAFFVICFFVPQIRGFVWDNLGPPVQDTLGNISTIITTSSIFQQYIAPFPNALLIGCVFIGFPLAYIWHRWIWNPTRAYFVQSAVKESGAVTMTEPISTISTPQPTPTQTKKEEPTAQPKASEGS